VGLVPGCGERRGRLAADRGLGGDRTRRAVRRGHRRAAGRAGRQQRQQVGSGETHAFGHRARLLKQVAQFTHVARPGHALEQAHRVLGQLLDRRAVRFADRLQQVIHQRRQVRGALTQRRQPDRHHRQPVVQVDAELAALHRRLEVVAGGRDHPHVHLDHPVRAHRLELLLLQHPQQLGLQRQRHVADLVEQQRAAIGELELAVSHPALGAGERTGRDAEELGLEQGVGNGRDVHPDERPIMSDGSRSPRLGR
jgi:hypothetical protein